MTSSTLKNPGTETTQIVMIVFIFRGGKSLSAYLSSFANMMKDDQIGSTVEFGWRISKSVMSVTICPAFRTRCGGTVEM